MSGIVWLVPLSGVIAVIAATILARDVIGRPKGTPEMQAVVQEFNQLVEDLKNKHIDRNEAFKRMAELDMKLQKQNELRTVKAELARLSALGRTYNFIRATQALDEAVVSCS